MYVNHPLPGANICTSGQDSLSDRFSYNQPVANGKFGPLETAVRLKATVFRGLNDPEFEAKLSPAGRVYPVDGLYTSTGGPALKIERSKLKRGRTS